MIVVLRHSLITVLLLTLNFLINPYPFVGLGLFFAYTVISSLLAYRPLCRELNRIEKRGRSGHIYAFVDVGSIVPAIKIGRESTKGQRLAAHRTAAPLGIWVLYNFKVADAVAAESYLHRRYAGQRLNTRNEWFYVTPSIMVETLLLRLFRA